MGLIIDRTEWIDSVYLIELTDPVQGGENGISNIQAKQLANRTRYLKALFDLEHTESGNHAIANEHVAEGAGIAESKLALVHTTSEIKGVSEDVRDKNEDVEYRLDDIIGIKGSMVSALGKAIPLSWRNSERGFEFDMFAAVFTYLDEEPVTITRTIVGDDSVDVSSTAKMVVGHTYVISDGNGYGTEVVKVKQILTSERFIATEKLKATRGSGILSQTSWLMGTGKAEARNGGVLVSKTINILQNHATGKFIARVKSNGAIVTTYYQAPGDSAWVRGVYLESIQRVAGYSDITYQVAGGPIILKLEVTTPSGITAEIDHMCVLPFQQGGVAEAVKQPVITSPVALESNVILTGPITWTAFRSLYGIAQKAVEVEIATDSAFTDVVWSFTGTNEVTSAITVDALEIDTAYYARVRQQDVEDVWSRYSDTVYFSTGEVLGVVTRPTNVFPSNGLTDIDKNVTITSSVFTSEPTDTHVASKWQIASDAGFSTILHDSGEVASLTSFTVPEGLLGLDTQYYWRVKYKGDLLGWSEFSTGTVFTTLNMQPIGVVLVTEGGNGGTWARIDESFNTVAPDGAFFSAHPVFGGMVDEIIDGQHMVRIPKFYYKVGTVASGTYAGKSYWMISDQLVDGFAVHPAFKEAGVELDRVYVGKYQASSASSKMQSIPGVLPAVSKSLDTFRTEANARNVSGVTGFMQWTMYQLGAIQMLYLIENATMDSQTKTGRGHVDNNPSSALSVDNTTVAQATYRGLVGLCGNVYQWVDGFKTVSGTVNVWDTNGNKTWVSTSQSIPYTGTIYQNTFKFGNLDPIFVGSTYSTTNSNVTCPDLQYFNSGGVYFPCVGGGWSGSTSAGLWCVDCGNASSYTGTSIGSRLAKV